MAKKHTAGILVHTQIKLRSFFSFTAVFCQVFVKNFKQNSCLRVASSLSYTTLLAIVPVTAIGFSVLSGFAPFEAMRAQTENFLLTNLAPNIGSLAKEYIQSFISNTRNLTIFGVIGTSVSALFFLIIIENVLNKIFRVTQTRPLFLRLCAFWAFLSLWPLMIGLSLSLSSSLDGQELLPPVNSANTMIHSAITELYAGFLYAVPFLLTSLGIAGMYLIIPNKKVRWWHALLGGVVAAVLFRLLRMAFIDFSMISDSQHIIYGALAVIPFFLIWMYLSWAAVLVGAVLTAMLPDYQAWRGDYVPSSSAYVRLKDALEVLHALFRPQGTLPCLKIHALATLVNKPLFETHQLLHALAQHNFVGKLENNQWILVRDLNRTAVRDLYHALNLALVPPKDEEKTPSWAGNLVKYCTVVCDNTNDVFKISLAQLFTSSYAGVRKSAKSKDKTSDKG